MKISQLFAYEIFDSRGLPTIECCIELENGKKVIASVPSGASVGLAEALEKRDGDIKRFDGKGVLQACATINKIISPECIGKSINALAMDSFLIDLDVDSQKKTIGANTTLAVSMALFKAQAAAEDIELYQLIQRVSGTAHLKIPTPFFNIINGGAHANNNLYVQEYMIVPQAHDQDVSKNYPNQLYAAVNFYQTLKTYFDQTGQSTNVGDEGGFAPDFNDDRKPLELLKNLTYHIPNFSYKFALDVAASELYDSSTGLYHFMGKANVSSDKLVEIYAEWLRDFPICSIEDGMSEDDIVGWKLLTEKFANSIDLIGDDLFVTSPMKIRKGVLQKTGNGALIKPNQIGTVSQTLAAIDAAKNHNFKVMISHRSGETNDTFIADLAVGVAADYIKSGAICRGERVAKYNRLLEINRLLYS